MAKCLHNRLTAARPNNSMKQLVCTSARSLVTPKTTGSAKSAQATSCAYRTSHGADLIRVMD